MKGSVSHAFFLSDEDRKLCVMLDLLGLLGVLGTEVLAYVDWQHFPNADDRYKFIMRWRNRRHE